MTLVNISLVIIITILTSWMTSCNIELFPVAMRVRVCQAMTRNGTRPQTTMKLGMISRVNNHPYPEQLNSSLHLREVHVVDARGTTKRFTGKLQHGLTVSPQMQSFTFEIHFL